MLFFAQMQPTIPELPLGPDLQNMRGPIEISANTTLQISLLVALLSGILLTAWLLYRRSKRKTPTETLSPYAQFKADIARVKNTTLSDPECPDLLSKTLRHYLISVSGSETYGVSSKELVGLAAKHPAIQSQTLEKIESTLRDLDQTRFRPNTLTPEYIIPEVENIVDSIEARIKKITENREAQTT